MESKGKTDCGIKKQASRKLILRVGRINKNQPMKRFLLFALAILIGLSGLAQIRKPGEKYPDPQFNWKQRSAVTPVQTQSFTKGTPWFKKNTKGSAEAPTFDPTWANRFQTVLDSVMEATNAKGASVAVYSPEYGMWTGVSGISHPGVPITSDMRFGVGSNTKLFIAVAMVKLQEEGILTLDDHLYQWLPKYQYVDSTITIRQLLKHESGLFDFWNDYPSLITQALADTGRFWTDEEIIESIGPPHFAPGNGYSYSNTNYVLAAMIIEAASGQTWVEKLHDIIFDPLSLDSTFVGAAEPRNGPCAAEWDIFGGTIITNVPMTAEYSQAHAAGAILATAPEMVQWYKALFEGSVISDSSLQMVLTLEPSSWYGLGIGGGPLNQGFYSHSGGMFGFESFILYDVQKQAIICILFNDRDSDGNSKLNALMECFYYFYPKEENDAGISMIKIPEDHTCVASFSPEAALVNYGINPLTDVSVHFQVDGGEISILNWTGFLNSGETESVLLPSINNTEGQHTFTVYTSLPNGEPEGHTFNDMAWKEYYVESATPVISELFEGFEDIGFPPPGWTVNPASICQWGITSLAGLSGNNSLVRCNYNDMWTGNQYDFELPLLNISSLYNTDFSFDYAYSAVPDQYGDTLQVMISSDCGATWQILFNKGGYELTTTYVLYDLFYPKSPSYWEHVSFPFQYFEGQMLIRFRAINGDGNNIFIDNINLDLLTDIKTEKIGYSFSLYPNPFTSEAIFTCHLTKPSQVKIEIYDSYGQLVAEPLNAAMQTGDQKMVWNAENLPAGIYYCRLKAGDNTAINKIIKMR